MRARTGQIIVIALAIAWAVGLRATIRWHERSAHTGHDDADDEWKQKARADIALLPPLLPPTGSLRSSGAARADARTVIALFRAKRTDELRIVLEASEAESEGDPSKEHDAALPWSAFAFMSDMRALDAWVATAPRSFVGYLARATARLAEVRRTKPASWDTEGTPQYGPESLTTLSQARQDLERAIEIRPGLTIAYALVISSYAIEHSRAPRELLDRALRVCPACAEPRTQYMLTLRPDRDAMRAFAEESQILASKNPRLRALRGYGDMEDCKHLEGTDEHAAAMASCDRALAEYPAPSFLRQRATIQYRMAVYADSAATLTTLLADDPFDLDALVDRARAYIWLEDWAKAAADLRVALQLDPTADEAIDSFRWLIQNLDRDARKFMQSGELAEAGEFYAFAARIVPEHRDFENARRAITARLGSSEKTAVR